MMTDILQVWHDFIRAHGISLESIGLQSRALTREESLTAIDFLQQVGIPILGGDVYYVEHGAIQPAYANWHVDRGEHESDQDFASRSWQFARQYLRDFPLGRDLDRKVYVDIVPAL